MVREATTRIAKYKAKIDADVIRSRIAAYGDNMKTLQEARQAEITTIQSDVKGILDEHGIAPTLVLPFMRIAMKLYKLSKKHTGAVFETEAKYELDKEYNRLVDSGFDASKAEAVLKDIAAYFNVTWSAPTAAS
ncbi:hypothetical protein J7L13_01825 [bacterium]|nr:hypothetical protein [bacterium]